MNALSLVFTGNSFVGWVVLYFLSVSALSTEVSYHLLFRASTCENSSQKLHIHCTRMSMTSPFFIIKFSLLFSSAIALPPHIEPISPGVNILDLHPGNWSVSTNATSLSNSKPLITCSGEQYRSNLKYSSCLDAVKQIPQDPRRRSFGLRTGGTYDVMLPSRFISCEYIFLSPFALPTR